MSGCGTSTKFHPIVLESPRKGRDGHPNLPRLSSFAILMVVACSSLPNVEDLLSPGPTRPPTIVDGDGRLSPPAAQQVMARLEQQVDPSEILRKHLADLETITRRPLANGNAVSVLKDGPSTYTAMFKAMERAKDHINLETYIFEDKKIGRRLADLLILKQRQGVQVNIIYDSFGSLETSADFFERLREGGVNLVEFNPVSPLNAKRKWILNQRDHRKILVVDGTVAFTGGLNISEVYSRSSTRSAKTKHPESGKEVWRDTHVEIRGPAVAQFQHIFLEAWSQQQGPPLPERRYFPQLTSRGQLVVLAIRL